MPPACPKSERLRADQVVVNQGLATSRSRAQALILAGAILQEDGSRVAKAGTLLPATRPLRQRGTPLPFVSRGGNKLLAALQHFAVPTAGSVCLDVGASTGGFTDCLLRHGAARVYAVDVGYGQLAWPLRCDPRVQVRERLNIRHATAEALPELADLVVIDVSFISLRVVLPLAAAFARRGAHLVALVKPQFEVGRAQIGKAGVVRDVAARKEAAAAIVEMAAEALGGPIGLCDSPLLGAKGNHEYLLHGRCQRQELSKAP